MLYFAFSAAFLCVLIKNVTSFKCDTSLMLKYVFNKYLINQLVG